MIALKKKLLMQGARPLRPQDVFATSLYTGNGGDQTITNGLDLAGKGGLIWTKTRSRDFAHALTDSMRGLNGVLQSNTPGADTSTVTDGVLKLNRNGYAIGNNGDFNRTTETLVSWSFRQADKFFAIRLIQHTTGTASTISLPSFGPIGMVIGKNRSASGNWPVWHRSLPAGQGLRLNLNAQAGTTEAWISVSGQTVTLSGSAPSGNYVLYVFAHNSAPIDCGSYVGNGNMDGNGPIVTCGNGWTPQFILQNAASRSGDWSIFDTVRGISTGVNTPRLRANTSEAEAAPAVAVDLTATGFQVKGTGTNFNDLNQSYLYLAVRAPT